MIDAGDPQVLTTPGDGDAAPTTAQVALAAAGREVRAIQDTLLEVGEAAPLLLPHIETAIQHLKTAHRLLGGAPQQQAPP